MATDKEAVINYIASWELEENFDDEIKQEHDVEKLIFLFRKISSGMDKRRYRIALHQINSLKKRMAFHPEKLSLTLYYLQEIKKIILYERGKTK